MLFSNNPDVKKKVSLIEMFLYFRVGFQSRIPTNPETIVYQLLWKNG